MIDDSNITVSIPLAAFVQLYNALDMLLDEVKNADTQVIHPEVVDIAQSRRDEFKVRIRNGLDINLGGA